MAQWLGTDKTHINCKNKFYKNEEKIMVDFLKIFNDSDEYLNYKKSRKGKPISISKFGKKRKIKKSKFLSSTVDTNSSLGDE